MKSRAYLFYTLLSCFILLFSACQENRKLPVYGQREAITVKNPDGSTSIDTLYQSIPAFRFLNQDSVYIDNATFKDKIYIADFFFTSCSGICPVMHRNMKDIYEKYKDNPKVMFLSHTIDFKYDKPNVLKRYAKKLGVNTSKWQFAYGEKEPVYQLAKDYLVAVFEDSKEKENYVHEGYLILVDQQKHIRGAYDGTNPDQVAQLLKDLPVLLAEDNK
ncbi:SCO family protein [Pedobacter metabolipauper]|uniref:Protein SCO1/2 n=1 Tax=Pedobacter metabolipauper TaxID=425513 RepID=A0A4R6SZ09_9SPHI|nr:SCO family protein [Pedobacter metabolipauper]TDQ11297.1 protein SCO1/2 [Pedobacter metabolipauper]